MGTPTNSDPNARFQQMTFRLGEEQNYDCDKALQAADARGDEEIERKLSFADEVPHAYVTNEHDPD